jgi:PAS domain S-box-containing protein
MAVAEGLIQMALLGEAVDVGPALVFVADEEMRYIAVNQRACDVLGYSRDEMLQFKVTTVAQAAESSTQFDEMLVRGFRHGTATLTCKDGSTVEFAYQARQTKVAGLPVYISVGFIDD